MPTHSIDWNGRSGTIFWLVIGASVVYLLGFATSAWRIFEGKYYYGIWQTCTCSFIDASRENDPDRFRAIQAMASIGGILIALALICVFMYMLCHCVNKNFVIKALAVLTLLASISMTIAVVIYGVTYKDNLHYSFALECSGAILSFIAFILSIIQMRSSGVRV